MSEDLNRLEELDSNEEKQDRPRELRGLYRYVKVSVPTLNLVIVGGIAIIVILLAFGVRNPGYTITFECQGGTPVESQKLMYGDSLVEPTPPTMEGYTFRGWYLDPEGNYEWDMERSVCQGPTTLYALWDKNE